MFKPAALFIGLRYARAQSRRYFISFIFLVSVLGTALSVMVLITVLSVMNGFDREIKQRVFSMVPPITIRKFTAPLVHWSRLQHLVGQKFSIVTASAPFVESEVLTRYQNVIQPVLLNGIVPVDEAKISQIAAKMIRGRLYTLQPTQFNIVIGENLAQRLGVSVGEKITVITSQVSVSLAGLLPRFKRFTITGIFRAGNGFGFDAGLAFIHLQDAQSLLGISQAVSGLHLQIPDVYTAPHVSEQITDYLQQKRFPEPVQVTHWAEQFGEFFHAVQLEKTIMFFILLLLIAVSAFNLVSMLVMVVHDKAADIAILRTFGMTPAGIMAIFIVQGGLVGLFGTLLGVSAGVVLSWNVTALVQGIEHLLHMHLLSASVYFVNYLPSEMQWYDVVKVASASVALSLLATLYPAWHAARLDPVEALRHE